MNKNYILPLMLGLAHGLNDCIAGYILGSAGEGTGSVVIIGALLLVYNVIAFGGQWPVGVLLDKSPRVKMVSIMSLAAALIALVIFRSSLPVAVILAGIASAFFHVSGGIMALRHPSNLHAAGLFAGPGVVGLIAGGVLAHLHIDIVPVVALVMCAVIAGIWILPYSEVKAQEEREEQPGIDKHDVLMIVLLLVISLRSACWDVFQLINEGNFVWLGWIAFAAAAGKMAGGFAAARIGARRYLFAALTISVLLLTFWSHQLIMLCVGIALLQSSIPVSMSLMFALMPSRPGSAAGLVLGAAIVFGGVLFYSIKHIPHAREILFAGMLVMLAGYFLFLRIFSTRRKQAA